VKGMAKNKRTSISIDPDIWKEWTKFVIDKTSSSRKASEVLENAMKEYMERHIKD
jgi:metal-responsive CopG/Arc/MetJ family transcriptional regulator